MNEPGAELSEGQLADFAYTDINKGPEQHKTVAVQFAMGLGLADISISTGYPAPYVEKILNHPPVIVYAGFMKKALDNQAVQLVGQWQSLLPKALKTLERSMDSKSDAVALRAATEYLDRERSLVFAKRRFVEGSDDSDILGTSAVDELKRNVANLEGQDNGQKPDESAREARYIEDGKAGGGLEGKAVAYPEPAD